MSSQWLAETARIATSITAPWISATAESISTCQTQVSSSQCARVHTTYTFQLILHTVSFTDGIGRVHQRIPRTTARGAFAISAAAPRALPLANGRWGRAFWGIGGQGASGFVLFSKESWEPGTSILGPAPVVLAAMIT